MERLQWLSERDAVSRLLAMTPAEALMNRLSLEDRLEFIDAQLIDRQAGAADVP